MSRRTRRLALLTAASAATALAPAAAAHAEIFCVNMPSCPAGIAKPDVQAAIDAAETDGNGADIVRIGPKATPYVGPFTYDDGGGGGKLTIEGSGIGQTVLSSSGAGGHTLSLAHADSAVKNLTLRTAPTGQFSALWLDGGRAERVRVEQTGSEFGASGVNLYGAGSAFADGEIAMTAGVAVRTGHPSGVAGLRVDRSTITGRGGLAVAQGSSLTVDRTTLDTSRGVAEVGGAGSSLTLTNSIARMGDAVGGDTALRTSGNGTTTVVHVTLLGSASGTALGAGSSANGWQATTQVRNSIVAGFPRYAACSGDNGGTALLTLQYTSTVGSTLTNDPDCQFTAGAGVLAGVAPQFVGGAPGADLATADLRLKAPSPLVDAGDPNGVLAVDFAGLSRPVDGDGAGGAKVDLGALEYRRQAPAAQLTVPPAAVVGQPITVDAAGTTDADGDDVTYAWAFGDGATATGPQATHAYASPGTQTVQLTVTDAAGRTDVKTATVQVSAPPPPPAPPATAGDTPAAPPAPAPAAVPAIPVPSATGSGPAADRVPPVLGRLRLARTARLGRGHSVLSRRGADLRLSLSEAATVTVTLKRGRARARRLTFAVSRPGTVAIALGRRSGLRPGRHAVTAVARDAAGNRSVVRRGTLRLR